MRSVGQWWNIMKRQKQKQIVNWIAFVSKKIQKAKMKLLVDEVCNMQYIMNHLVKARILTCHPPDLRAPLKNKRFSQNSWYMESMFDCYLSNSAYETIKGLSDVRVTTRLNHILTIEGEVCLTAAMSQNCFWKLGAVVMRSQIGTTTLGGSDIHPDALSVGESLDCWMVWKEQMLALDTTREGILLRLAQLQNYLWNIQRLVSDKTWLQQLREECCTLVKSLSWISEYRDNSEVRLNVTQWWSWVVFREESGTLAENQRGVES